jgi:hypothetical protein
MVDQILYITNLREVSIVPQASISTYIQVHGIWPLASTGKIFSILATFNQNDHNAQKEFLYSDQNDSKNILVVLRKMVSLRIFLCASTPYTNPPKKVKKHNNLYRHRT